MTISRRDFLKTSSMFAAWAALSACAPVKEATPEFISTLSLPTIQNTPLDEEGLILHTLRRM